MALLSLIAEGDERAFRALFDHYNKLLFTFAEAMLKSGADAEEVVQECFTKLWVNRKNLPGIEHPGQYLYKMVRNRCLDHLRRAARERRLADQVWANISQTDHSLEEELRSREYQELIEHALLELPAQKQLIYRLSREKEYTHEQISAITGLSRSRVNNILVETLKHIKDQLGKHSGGLAIIFWLAAWDRLF
jgi:RNA polymerase sigma-70 factor (ECF subfamily)